MDAAVPAIAALKTYHLLENKSVIKGNSLVRHLEIEVIKLWMHCRLTILNYPKIAVYYYHDELYS